LLCGRRAKDEGSVRGFGEVVNWKKFLVIAWLVIIGLMLAVAGELDDAPGLILIALVTTPTFVALTYKA
jgi:hypothetical protein